jgi:hypothetical protein
LEIYALDLAGEGVRYQRAKEPSQFILREVTVREFRDAQFDLASDSPNWGVRFSRKAPGFVIEPISKLVERSCIA